MASSNANVDFDQLAKYSSKVEEQLKTIKSLNEKLDAKTVEMQKVWYSNRAMTLYKQLKQHIDNNYKFINSWSLLNDDIQMLSKYTD